jgi:hypothetical protein
MDVKYRINQQVYLVKKCISFFNPDTFRIVQAEIDDIEYCVQGVIAYIINSQHYLHSELYSTREEAEKAILDYIEIIQI